MKKAIFSLLTLTALSAISFPVHAEGDTAVVQDARQSVYQTGEYNSSNQSSSQRNRIYQNGARRGNTGEVMTVEQLSDQYGRGNRTEQRIEQENNRTYNAPRSRSCDRRCYDN